MKILFFNYEYPPLGGGAGNATFYLLQEFSKIPDLTVDLITSSIDNNYHEEKLGTNIVIHQIPIGKNKNNFHFQSQKDLLIYSWEAYFFARKLIRKNHYDLTHSFFSVPCGFLSYLLKRSFKTPYLVSLRGADVPGYSERFSVLYVILKPLVKLIWANAQFVISNSQGLKDLAIKTNLRQEIGIIPNGIDTSQFQPNLEARLPSDNLKILCVSRLTQRKGIKYLIEAFGKLIKKYPQLSLTIAGRGDGEENLKAQVKSLYLEKKVEFLGLVPHEKLPSIYAQADVFVLPSLNEGMSNTMLEALASGLPLIATDTGGTKELLDDNVNGFIVKMKNSQDLAEKIEGLIKNTELRKNMARASRKKAESLSWKNVSENYFNLYQRTHL